MRKSVWTVGVAATAVASALVPATAYSAVRPSTTSDALVTAVSCSSGGTCAAGGQAFRTFDQGTPFVLTGKDGQWGKPVAVPGLAALKPFDADIQSVSCAPAGGCVAGGEWVDVPNRNHVFHVFVTSERNGKWSHLTQIFSGKLAGGPDLSCPAQGSCAAGGGLPLFVVTEAHNRWGRPTEFPTKAKFGGVGVTCASAGTCSAWWETHVATERNGHWSKPITLPGLAKLGSHAGITSLACPTANNCVAGGSYLVDANDSGAFVASERNGHWGNAMKLPGFAALNTAQDGGGISTLSCLSPGNCVAGGTYAAPADFAGGAFEAFVASERNGRWSKAIEVPGIPAPGSAICEPDSDACVAGQVVALSCSRDAGTCVAGGWYDTKAINGSAAFVTTYKNGRWSKVMQFSGLAASDDSVVNSLSCSPSGSCAAGGSGRTTGPGFLAFEKNGTWSPAQPVSF